MLADTMKQVKAAEEKAAELVSNAKEQAAGILGSARDKAKRTIADATDQAEKEAKAALEKAFDEGTVENENYASKISAELDQTMQQAMKKSDAAVDVILANLV